MCFTEIHVLSQLVLRACLQQDRSKLHARFSGNGVCKADETCPAFSFTHAFWARSLRELLLDNKCARTQVGFAGRDKSYADLKEFTDEERAKRQVHKVTSRTIPSFEVANACGYIQFFQGE